MQLAIIPCASGFIIFEVETRTIRGAINHTFGTAFGQAVAGGALFTAAHSYATYPSANAILDVNLVTGEFRYINAAAPTTIAVSWDKSRMYVTDWNTSDIAIISTTAPGYEQIANVTLPYPQFPNYKNQIVSAAKAQIS